MQQIEKISNYIEEEIDGASDYIETALLYKVDNPKLAQVFYEISADELKHVTMLHGVVATLIEQYREEVGQPPSDMLALYEYLHKKHIMETNRVKLMQAQYRE